MKIEDIDRADGPVEVICLRCNEPVKELEEWGQTAQGHVVHRRCMIEFDDPSMSRARVDAAQIQQTAESTFVYPDDSELIATADIDLMLYDLHDEGFGTQINYHGPNNNFPHGSCSVSVQYPGDRGTDFNCRVQMPSPREALAAASDMASLYLKCQKSGSLAEALGIEAEEEEAPRNVKPFSGLPPFAPIKFSAKPYDDEDEDEDVSDR